MALPKINETLNFNMKIPSTGQRVKYRPYLVKEEKILLQAFESGDVTTCLEAMIDTLAACLDQKESVDLSSLATFDIEYMFTQVRGKSVGESSTILVKCKECGEPNEYVVDLEELVVDVSHTDNIIEINSDISVEMKYPTYKNLMGANVDKIQANDTESAMELLAASVGAVLTNEERIECADQKLSEVVDFLSSMTTGQLQKVSQFLEDMPALKHQAVFACKNCETHNEMELKGLSDFF